MEFSRQEYWSGEPFPSPGDLPNPGTEPGSPPLQADSLPCEPPGKPSIDKGMGTYGNKTAHHFFYGVAKSQTLLRLTLFTAD